MLAYVARQPIFDRSKKVFAYELLFRNGIGNYMPEIDGDTATSSVLSNSYLMIGMDKVTGGKKAFVNFTQKLIEKEMPLLFSKESTVIEILEDVKPEKALLAACRNLAKNGYTLALDDFIFHDSLEPLMELADIIKFDLRITPVAEVRPLMERLKHKKIHFLAEKVENHEEFQLAMDAGFHYFQGYFFCKPEVIEGKQISGSKLLLLQIIAEVGKPDFEFGEIESMIAKDLSISYKLLRYINSAFFRRRKEITSLKEAILLLGQEELRRFVSLIVLSKMSSDKPDELIRLSCIHAKFCESLGDLSTCYENRMELFIVGLFSNIDAVLDQTMQTILQQLPFSKKISDALLYREGKAGKFLRVAECYTLGEWEEVQKLAVDLCILEEKIPAIYAEACEWAEALVT